MCKLWFHKWFKWVDIASGITMRKIDGVDREVGKWVQQERVCQECGNKQLREIST